MANNQRAMEKALENPLILQNIFRKLGALDLLSCRLVNRLNWFDLANKILIEKKPKINYNFPSLQSSQKLNDTCGNPLPLKSLINCIKESIFFPFVRFRFSGECFEDEDFLEFFSVYGDSIIELELDLICRKNVNSTVEKFGEILRKHLPNLESLTIWEASLGWSGSSRLFPKKVRPLVKLLKLKYLNFGKSLEKGGFKFIQDIQDAAPNLQHVKYIPLAPSKIELGSKLTETIENMPGYSVREEPTFTEVSIDLKEAIKDPEFVSNLPGILSKFLDLSQPSLKQPDGVTVMFDLDLESDVN